MDQIEQGQVEEGTRLRTAFMYWVIGLVVWIALLALSGYASALGGLAFFFYFAMGFYLNKVVLPNLIEWHPMHNTLANVTSEKLKLFLAWPVTYFILFMKLGINKML